MTHAGYPYNHATRLHLLQKKGSDRCTVGMSVSAILADQRVPRLLVK